MGYDDHVFATLFIILYAYMAKSFSLTPRLIFFATRKVVFQNNLLLILPTGSSQIILISQTLSVTLDYRDKTWGNLKKTKTQALT